VNVTDSFGCTVLAVELAKDNSLSVYIDEYHGNGNCFKDHLTSLRLVEAQIEESVSAALF
jgi:hypothetical protein